MNLKTLQVQFAHLSERTNTEALLVGVGGATERSFRKIELLEIEEEEEEEENFAAICNDDVDDNYDNTDIFCEQDGEEDYDLCSGCDENSYCPPCATMRAYDFTNCVKKSNCQFCGC